MSSPRNERELATESSTPADFDAAPRRAHSLLGPREAERGEFASFERAIERWRAGRAPDPLFVEQRLRLGVYGQRQDGVHMLRSKLPLGIVDAEQLEALADVAQWFGGGVAHLTTRQDVQVHFVELERTPELMRVLERVDATTREACGNVVRNVTAGERSGVAPGEVFDVTATGLALARYLLRHPDAQGLGRKFKIHLAGSDDPRDDRGAFHDLGLRAVERDGPQGRERGFHVVVGGGLGAAPHEALEYAPFVPESELGELARALLVLFARHGEKRSRSRARLKFLVAEWGIERVRREVEALRAAHGPDPAWRALLTAERYVEPPPSLPPGRGFPVGADDEQASWLRTNVALQRQAGYAMVRVRVPRGDLSAAQLRGLAQLVREHCGGALRVSVDQGLLLRWVPLERLLATHVALRALELGAPRAGGLGDSVTCPGADTCKLGITSPRSLARSIQPLLDELAADPRLERLRVHISGCPNACAQHQIADIGLFGAARQANGRALPHYMLVLGGLAGGRGAEPGEGFGTTFAKLPAARVGEALRRLALLFRDEARESESFGSFARRIGRARVQALLADLGEIAAAEEAALAREPGAERDFEVRRGVGECAGGFVDGVDLALGQADAELERARAALEAREPAPQVVGAARAALLFAARALLGALGEPAGGDVQANFRRAYFEAGRIYEGVALGFFAAFERSEAEFVGARLRALVVDAELFVEEAHAILAKLRPANAAPRERAT